MTGQKVSTGSARLDSLLRGGFKRGELVLLYGEASTGKTAAILQAAYVALKHGMKVLYIDTERSFTPQGFKQVAGRDSEELSRLVTLFLPKTFEEQERVIDLLENYVTEKTGLIVVDSMTELYRVSLTDAKNTFRLNKALAGQLAQLKSLAAKRGIVCVVTSQVHTKIGAGTSVIEPVARRVLFHFAGTVVHTKSTSESNVKEFVVERLRGTERYNMSCRFLLKGKGVEDFDSPSGPQTGA